MKRYKAFMPLTSISEQYHVYEIDAVEAAISLINGVGVYWQNKKIGEIISAEIVEDKVIFEYRVDDKQFKLFSKGVLPVVEIGFP